MYETVRIVGDKRAVVVLLVLIVVNAIIFFRQYDMTDEYEYYSDNYEENYNEFYDKLICEYASVNYQEGYERLKQKYDELIKNLSAVQDYEIEATAFVCGRLEYLTGYSDKYVSVSENAEKLLLTANYSDEDSFSYKNIKKTVEDYENIKGIAVTLDDERGVNALLEYNFTDYIFIVLIMVVILVVYDERKKSVWGYLYATYEGRKKLAFYKVCGIYLFSLAAGIVLYLENVICVLIKFGGLGDLTRAAQSNEFFENLTMQWSMGKVLIISLFVKIAVIGLVGILFWIIISNLSEPVIAFLIYGIFIFLEYYAYSTIDIHSVLKNLKYINIFAFLDSQSIIGKYMNLDIFGNAINGSQIMFVVVSVFSVSGIFLTIYLGKRKPFVTRKRYLLKMDLNRYCSMILHELYKLVVCQKIGMILILFVVVAYCMTRPQQLAFEYDITVYNQYMEGLAGEVTELKTEYLANEIDLWQKKIDELQLQLDEYYSGETELSQSEVESIELRINNTEKVKDMTEELYTEAVEMLGLKEKGYNVEFVNRLGYDMLIGSGSMITANQDAIVLLAFLVLAISTMYSHDNQCDMSASIKTTANGRRRYALSKNLIVFFIIAFLVVVMFGFRASKIKSEYGLSGFFASAKSLQYLKSVDFNISIGRFLLLFIVLRVLMLFMTAQVILFISSKAKNNILSISVSAVTVLIPACMLYVGIDGMRYVSVLECVSITPLWNEVSIFGKDFIIHEMVLFMAGIMIGAYYIFEDKISNRIEAIKRKGGLCHGRK